MSRGGARNMNGRFGPRSTVPQLKEDGEGIMNDKIEENSRADSLNGFDDVATFSVYVGTRNHTTYHQTAFSSSDPEAWSKILSDPVRSSYCIEGFLAMCNGEVKEGALVLLSAGPAGPRKYNVDTVIRDITEEEKDAFCKALFNQYKRRGEENLSLSPVKFESFLSSHLTAVAEAGLSKFIAGHFDRIMYHFVQENQSPFYGAKNLAEETTNSLTIRRENPAPKPERQRGPWTIEGVPMVTESIISASYVSALVSTNHLLLASVLNVSTSVEFEKLRKYGEMIAGAISGYNGKLDLLNKRNAVIFDSIWGMIPFSNNLIGASKAVVDAEYQLRIITVFTGGLNHAN